MGLSHSPFYWKEGSFAMIWPGVSTSAELRLCNFSQRVKWRVLHKPPGIWHSRYLYYSGGRDQELEGEHYVVLRQDGSRVEGQSLPHSMDSLLRLHLSVDGPVATGTWTERTSPDGYYKGATYDGTIQLLIDPAG